MARTSQNSSHKAIERYVPDVRLQGGVLTYYPVVVNNSLTVNGNIITTGTVSGGLTPVATISTSTAAPTVAQSGTTFLLARAAGSTITLPTASAATVGLKYRFVVTTAVTSNAYKIYTGSASIFYVGTDAIALVGTATGDSEFFQGDGATNTYFNMNGTTTGGLVGSTIEVTCVSATQWQINAVQFGSGTLATSFATS